MNKLDRKIRNLILNTFNRQLDYATNGIIEEEVDKIVSQIKQSILKAIMKNKPKVINDPSENYELGQEDAIEDFESVIKEVLGK